MILPSGSSYSIFYSGLTNVINRFMYSLSSFPKITFVRVFFCTISDFTCQLFSTMLHCIVSYLENFQFFSLVFNTIYDYETQVCQSSLSNFIIVMHVPSLSVIRKTKAWLSMARQASHRLHHSLLINCPEELLVESLGLVAWLSQGHTISQKCIIKNKMLKHWSMCFETIQ